jgi:hypothetical protein
VTLPTRAVRLRRLVAGTVAVVGLGTLLSACGTDGTALAKRACTHVDRSLALFTEATTVADPSRATQLRDEAYIQLRQALPIAAQAAYHDGQWQALMTTLAESSRVPESTLASALRQQCQQAEQSVTGQPPPPSGSIPPPSPFNSKP